MTETCQKKITVPQIVPWISHSKTVWHAKWQLQLLPLLLVLLAN